MKSISSALVLATALTFAASVPSLAASLPAIKTGSGNVTPECATPGRMMAMLAARNGSLDARFGDIATYYMRHGEDLGLRWDYAFFQMILETGNLSFKNGNRQGSVRPSQNNFAGLGATGGKEPGEGFKDVETGVKAHLQHLVMYSGARVEDPVAERTRKVQEWGVLTSWHKGFKRPITFADLAAKWAPGSGGYGRDIDSIAGNFKDDFCGKPDPKPHLVQDARAGRGGTKVAAAENDAKSDANSSGKALARQAIERAKAEGDGTRSALGAALPSAPTASESRGAGPATPGLKILNGQTGETAEAPPAERAPVKPAPTQTAAAGSAARSGTASPPPKTQQQAQPATKCRVWTASYGGQKSVIIRSSGDQLTNYTVLDVNDGQEVRETEAYISAYAKGGQKIGDFANQNAALDKAFQLCPEG